MVWWLNFGNPVTPTMTFWTLSVPLRYHIVGTWKRFWESQTHEHSGSVRLSVIHLFETVSVLPVYPPVYGWIDMSSFLSVCIYPCVCLAVCPPVVYLFVCLYLSTWLSVCMCLSTCFIFIKHSPQHPHTHTHSTFNQITQHSNSLLYSYIQEEVL